MYNTCYFVFCFIWFFSFQAEDGKTPFYQHLVYTEKNNKTRTNDTEIDAAATKYLEKKKQLRDFFFLLLCKHRCRLRLLSSHRLKLHLSSIFRPWSWRIPSQPSELRLDYQITKVWTDSKDFARSALHITTNKHEARVYVLHTSALMKICGEYKISWQ